MLRRAFLAAAGCLLAIACGRSSTPPTPSPPGGGGESITGRERLGWDQPAASPAELATFRYAIYVDNVRSVLAEVTCAQTAGPNGYSCSGRLPAMSNGSHVLELASFTESPALLESPRSQPLRVTVTGATPGVGTSGSLTNGGIVETVDGVRLQLEVVYEGLREPRAIALAPDDRVFVGTADGVLMLKDGVPVGPPQLTDAPTLAIDFSPDFSRDGHVFVTQALPSASGATVFRTSRVRDMGGWLADRMVILEHGPASAAPAAALRLSADGKLHLAFDDGGDADGAERMAEWRGKLLLKGVERPDDAERAVTVGCDGVVVSNHGGRQLDGASSTLDALPAVSRAAGSRITVLLDGGVRRGVDILKARALGAQAVLTGRATLFGAMAGGETGAQRALEILSTELVRAMQLCGVRSPAEIGPQLLCRNS